MSHSTAFSALLTIPTELRFVTNFPTLLALPEPVTILPQMSQFTAVRTLWEGHLVRLRKRGSHLGRLRAVGGDLVQGFPRRPRDDAEMLIV